MIDSAKDKLFLRIGEVECSDQDKIIWTDLGSCISVILFHTVHKYYGICHAQLPFRKLSYGSCTTSCPNHCHRINKHNDLIYVICTIKYLISKFRSLGMLDSKLHISLIGGAELTSFKKEGKSIGAINVEVAKEMLRKNSLQIDFEDTGGNESRRLFYNTGSGSIRIQKQKKSEF